MKIDITTEVSSKEWRDIAGLITQAVPNALVSKLGNAFGAAFYSKVVEQEYSCGYVARGESGNILGVVIGTTDYPKARSTAFKGQSARLLVAANLRLFRWSVISWAIKGVLARVRGKEQDYPDRPIAELVVIVVCPKARGTGLAQELIEKMEKSMVSKGLSGLYSILTEKANTRANKFYEKIGATFARTNLHHAREINEWHKKIPMARQDE